MSHRRRTRKENEESENWFEWHITHACELCLQTSLTKSSTTTWTVHTKIPIQSPKPSPLKKMYLWKHVLHVYLRLYVEIYIAFEHNKFATFLTKIAIPPISNVVNAVVMNILSGLRNISVHLDWSLSLLHLRLVQLIALNAHLIALNTACDYNKSMKRCVASHYTAFKSKSIKLPFKHTVYWSGLYQSIWNIDRNQVDIIKNMPNSLTLRILA